MGVIQRQSIKQSMVNYIAVAVAAVSTILVYPQDLETYGIARFVIDTGTFLAPFMLLGAGGVGIKFFPDFHTKEKDNQGLLFILLMWVVIGCLLVSGSYLLFKTPIHAYYEQRDPLFGDLLPLVLAIGILYAFFTLLLQYSSNFKRIVVPSMFSNLIKIILPILMLLYIGKWISLKFLLWGIIANFILALIGMVGYLIYLGVFKVKVDFSLLKGKRRSAMVSFGLFFLLSSMGSVLAFKIDSIMISTLIDFESTGVFAIAAFIGNAIAIPTNAITQITSPIVAASIKKNDFKHIDFLYKETSINLLLIGLLLFICILCSIEDLFMLMPNNEALLKNGFVIVMLVGISKVIDMATSINNPIIYYSKYYKFGFVAILLMAVFNVFTNLLLIPKFQIVGVALATVMSLSLFNICKLIFIWWKLKLQPFSLSTLKLLVVAALVFVVGFYLPLMGMPLIKIILRSIVIGLLYVGIVYYLKISLEFNKLLNKGFNQIVGGS